MKCLLSVSLNVEFVKDGSSVYQGCPVRVKCVKCVSNVSSVCRVCQVCVKGVMCV